MSLEEWKSATDILANLAILVAGVWGLYTYSKAKKLDRAKWLKDLYEKFYEKPDLKVVRNTIDEGDESKINKYVTREPSEFTDYLNFFEFIGHLREQKQISNEEVIGLFDYYLRSLKKPVVLKYVQDKSHGYEKLASLLEEL
ncbi:MAG: hypothetical protein AB1428_12390 [Bacteroidota bacterium]